ncbi:AbrB/MazE/SpoVT family DNA-binding domain-containing protein [Microbacterium aoyamense]|uniref:AbrB/MazE/SpoVT family DNA-binding domain-containing protein n=1 Tax=Microbacterium aoyamense TaxID=344166 RepID=A0ABP5AQT9_9MICO
MYLAFGAGIAGAIYGLTVALVATSLELTSSSGSFGLLAACGSAIVAVVASAVGYWRARDLPGQEWRRALPPWKFTVNTVSVVIVHAALAFVVTYALYRLLALGFIGLPVIPFWAVVLMAVTLGLTAWIVYLSVASMTTQRMSSLLMAFIAIGTLTAMVTTPDPEWWAVHFSHLGSFDDVSSWVFNGTLIAGGLLVTTFAVYIANDLDALTAAGALTGSNGQRIVPALFVVMGIMLACVGLFPVDVNLLVHNLSAMGMAAMFLVLLIGGPRLLRGMPRTYFVSAWAFLAALVASIVLFAIGYFSLTAFEIIVFALIFGWIAVFIRFLAVSGQKA